METTDTPAISAAGALTGSERLLDVPGVHNLRDVGGFAAADGRRVRAGALYRSGALGELTPEGAERLAELGLNTVVDLRSEPEIRRWPDLSHGLPFSSVNLPTLPPFEATSGNPDSAVDASPDASLDGEPDADGQGGAPAAPHHPLEPMYAFMADVAGPPILACVRRLLEPGALPALLHCAVGKDRTGVTVAVILSALGVDEADITDDYVLSNLGLGLLGEPVHYLDEHGVDRISRPVHPDLLALFLRRTSGRYGSMQAYLRHLGLTSEELRRLRELLTESA
ncbi:tyrosine-protein phosphatase [Streptacidiphilus sp. PB12-B1b]|uniref:tyrosine-protein phosphatase n=1 Tax=Streptacidiphilus sp. PB12-B1b TaxID=2705012 RepID=UPI0015FA7365|nr:tyrosine-protein phosphatase [Streptacidiphilus sp. PB12-B1b]QMU75260.1 tyrosine-protein phosphatase [Streptacidiphilus sp. PB12-B1b]